MKCLRVIRPGFTLVDTLAVVCLLALVSTGVVLAVRGPLLTAKSTAAIQELIELQEFAQQRSLRVNIEMEISLAKQTIAVRSFNSDETAKLIERSLAPGVKIDLVIHSGATVRAGSARFFYLNGRTKSHAMLVSAGSRKVWLIVAGPLGRLEMHDYEPGSETQIQSWFSKWNNLD